MRIKETHFTAGNYYHLYNHAVQKSRLFIDDQDYKLCLDLVRTYLKSSDFSVIAFCLMPNHYHFLIRQNSDCAVFVPFNKIWFRYSRYYNKKYNTKGSIFAGKLQHIHVDKNEYFLRLIAYILMNPVSANLVSSPGEWPWSNYLEWAGLRNKELFDKQMRDTWGDCVKYDEKEINEHRADEKNNRQLID